MLADVKMAKTIWSISQYASPPKYGHGTGHHFLSQQHVQNGRRVVIFSSAFNHYMKVGPVHDKWAQVEVVDGVEYCWLKCRTYEDAHGIGRIINWLLFIVAFFALNKSRFGRPDVVLFSSHSLLPIVCAVWTKWRYRTRLVVEIRDVWPDTLIELGGISRWHPLAVLIGACERIAYNHADWIVSTLPNLSNHIAAVLGRKGFRFRCIPQGYPELYMKGKTALPEEFLQKYFTNEALRVVYAGSIAASNALDTLVEVIVQLAQEPAGQKIHFYILGDGAEKARLQRACIDCANVSFVARIDRAYVQDFLEQCDVAYDSVRTAKIYENGLSRQKWMDYMWAGLPIIASYSGYRSLINEAGCGEFVPAQNVVALKESVLRYAGMQREAARDIGHNGKVYVSENRTFDRLARQYEEVFDRDDR